MHKSDLSKHNPQTVARNKDCHASHCCVSTDYRLKPVRLLFLSRVSLGVRIKAGCCALILYCLQAVPPPPPCTPPHRPHVLFTGCEEAMATSSPKPKPYLNYFFFVSSESKKAGSGPCAAVSAGFYIITVWPWAMGIHASTL